MAQWANLIGLILNFLGAMALFVPSPVHTGVPAKWAFRLGVAFLATGFFFQLLVEGYSLFPN